MRIKDEKSFEKENVFGLGVPNDAYAQYFIGHSYLNPLTEMGKCPVFLANVTFEPDVEITGIFIMRKMEEDRFLFVRLVKAGIRKKEKKQLVYNQVP